VAASLNEQDNNNIDISENNNRVREVVMRMMLTILVSCFSRKKFLKAKDNKNLFKIKLFQ